MKGTRLHLLIVDDNEDLLATLEEILEEAGYRCQTAKTVAQANEAVWEGRFDLILLDWMLPDGSGVDLLVTWREERLDVPVLLFSSKSEVDEKVEALDSGADDYLPKPFSTIELLARIRALTRRTAQEKRTSIPIDNLLIDTVSRTVTVAENRIYLSMKEFDLLELLARHRGMVLTRYQLLQHICHDYESRLSNVVDAHIKNIRKKCNRTDLIKTVRGIGYMIERADSSIVIVTTVPRPAPSLSISR